MLLGNPRAPGRRLVILLFDERNQPIALVKAGTNDAAVKLIEAELNFLKTQPMELLQAPRVLGEWSADGLRAFAMEYATGITPLQDEPAVVARVLSNWVRADESVQFGELPAARRLKTALVGDAQWGPVVESLNAVRLHPVIHHGDFAPWNVRVDSHGNWRVLDWERGETAGPPAWDWFHWVVQPEVLVRRASTDEIAWRVDELLHTQEFQRYVRTAGIAGHERQLLQAYLLYCARVIKQVDGLPAIESLLAFLAGHRGCRCHGH